MIIFAAFTHAAIRLGKDLPLRLRWLSLHASTFIDAPDPQKAF